MTKSEMFNSIKQKLDEYNDASQEDINQFFDGLKMMIKQDIETSDPLVNLATHVTNILSGVANIYILNQKSNTTDPSTTITNTKKILVEQLQQLQELPDEELLNMRVIKVELRKRPTSPQL